MRRLCLVAIVGTLGWGYSVGLGQEAHPFDEEMQRWRQEHKRHLSRLLEIRFEERAKGVGTPRILDDLLAEYPADTLEVLEKYQADPSPRVRADAYGFIHRVGLLTRDPAIRKRVVGRLVDGCRDPKYWQFAARGLLDYKQWDFTEDARAVLREFVVKEPIRDDVLLVLGVAGMGEMDSWLKKLSDKHFNAVLALARLGDDDAARRAVARVDKVENMAHRVSSRWLGKLGYTRHPIALEYIASYLDNEEGEIIKQPGGDFSSPPYKHFALRAIAKHFPECPVTYRPGRRYSDAEYVEAHEWVKQRLQQTDK